MIQRKTIEERFWSKVDKTNGHDSCWIWKASKNKLGYGWFGMGGHRGKVERAHRVAMILSGHSLTSENLVCHKCDNPSCVNPGHLFIGTQFDNMRDMAAKGRSGPRNRPERMARGDKNGARVHNERMARGVRVYGAKLNDELAREIYASGLPIRELSRRHGVDRKAISLLKKGVTWRHATEALRVSGGKVTVEA